MSVKVRDLKLVPYYWMPCKRVIVFRGVEIGKVYRITKGQYRVLMFETKNYSTQWIKTNSLGGARHKIRQQLNGCRFLRYLNACRYVN